MKTYDDKDWAYADTRLKGSLVSNKEGVPVYVNSVFENNVEISTIKNPGTLESCKVKSFCMLEDLRINPVKLGYANEGEIPVYLQRKPIRFWKQGLTPENLSAQFVNNGVWDNYFYPSVLCESIVKTVLNIYPKYMEALESAIRGLPKAFSRDFAIYPDFPNEALFYKKRKVGEIVEGKPILSNEYFFLKESLEESIYGKFD